MEAAGPTVSDTALQPCPANWGGDGRTSKMGIMLDHARGDV